MKTTFKYFVICLIGIFFITAGQNEAQAKASTSLLDSLKNLPAPEFVLKDLNGKNVSLASLRGKTVVIDFWATWCHYCIKSFPSAQRLINKYKNDPKVVFLFIDTHERNSDYLSAIDNLLKKNQYTFNVLIDEKDDLGVQGKIFKEYKVKALPTKIIIDRKGIIRYNILGFDDELPIETEVLNISSKIDQVNNL